MNRAGSKGLAELFRSFRALGLSTSGGDGNESYLSNLYIINDVFPEQH